MNYQIAQELRDLVLGEFYDYQYGKHFADDIEVCENNNCSCVYEAAKRIAVKAAIAEHTDRLADPTYKPSVPEDIIENTIETLLKSKEEFEDFSILDAIKETYDICKGKYNLSIENELDSLFQKTAEDLENDLKSLSGTEKQKDNDRERD